jgi:hypothetical protein
MEKYIIVPITLGVDNTTVAPMWLKSQMARRASILWEQSTRVGSEELSLTRGLYTKLTRRHPRWWRDPNAFTRMDCTHIRYLVEIVQHWRLGINNC